MVAEQLGEQSRELEDRWARPARFGRWLIVVVGPAWWLSLAAAEIFERDPEMPWRWVFLTASIAIVAGSVVLVALLIVRYRRGEEKPVGPLGTGGKWAIAGLVALGFVGFMLWANRPLS